jgi:hypothetical protein
MVRDEDVTVQLPVVETDTSRDRVYVPPKTVPPKTKIATVELQTVQVLQEPSSREAPTVRLARARKGSPPPQDVPTDRPGQVWQAPPDDDLAAESQNAVTRRLPPVNGVTGDARELVTRPGSDPREAATLAPGEVGTLDGPPAVYVRTDESFTAGTPRPASRITGEELEAIQSARTLEVRQVPGPPAVATGARRRGVSVALIVAGMLLGVLIVWTAVLVGRGGKRAAPVTDGVARVVVPASGPSKPVGDPAGSAFESGSAAPAIDVAPAPPVREPPPANPSARSTPSRPERAAPSRPAESARSRAIY